MIDLHTHLDLYPNPLEIVATTDKMNSFTLAVTTSPRAWIATSKVFIPYKNIHVALGIHPEIVQQKYSELELLLSSISKTRFIGEVGIDGSPRFAGTVDQQEYVFTKILEECQRSPERIISIHSRNALSRILPLLERYHSVGKFILHWFSGTQSELSRSIDIGCWFSVGPAMIQSKKGNNLVSKMPRNRIFPESDGPFAVMNGAPVFPWEAQSITSQLKIIWGLPAEKINNIFSDNLMTLLG